MLEYWLMVSLSHRFSQFIVHCLAFPVNKYFWRGCRGEFGYFIFTKPSVMVGVREYSRKLGRFFKPTASIISLTLFSYVPIATTNRFIFSDNVDTVSSKLVWVLVRVLVWVSPEAGELVPVSPGHGAIWLHIVICNVSELIAVSQGHWHHDL